MKVSFISVRSSAKAGVGLLAGALLVATNALGVIKPAEPTGLPNLDTRVSAPASAAETQSRKTAVASLQRKLPTVNVTFDPLLETPKFVRARSGFLSGVNGTGPVAAPGAGALPPNDPFRSVRTFLDEHSGLYAHGAEALENATITRDSVTALNGLRTVVWQQQLDGLPVFESVLIGNITAKGELASIAGGFIPNATQAADAGTPNRSVLQNAPVVSAEAAIAAAARNIGETLEVNQISALGVTIGAGYEAFQARRVEAHTRRVWLPLNRGNLRLNWEVIIPSQNTPGVYQILVDAESGKVNLRRNLTSHLSDATYNVYTSDSPSPFSPGHPTPSNVQPPLVNRTLVTLSALDVNASPNGWINDGDNETQGNNAVAFPDRDFDQQPDGPLPQGNPNRVFDFPMDLTQEPDAYTNASTVQLFYLLNYYHDRLYQLGFTESAGNFQEDNFGRGGIGGDRIIGYVQSGAAVGIANNAAFATPPDGFNGQMFQFIMNFPNPDRDSSLDAEVVYHEATHGTSGRLVGGGVLISALQTAGMGEGWGDFVGLSLLSEPADDPDAVYASGGYFAFQLGGLDQNYYYGDRHFPYTTDMRKNPFTFKDIDPTQISAHPGVPRSPLYPFSPQEASEVHHQGEVWCVTLMEVRANLIAKHGFAGNEIMLRLVIDGMKLGPANPTFLEARDAILLADQVNNGGANYLEIWRGFAKRGMGFSAVAPPSTTTTGVIEAFDLPGLQVSDVYVTGGNGNGFVDYNECNDLFIVLTNLTLSGISNVQVTLSTPTPGVAIGVRNSPYPDMGPGDGGTNLVAFTLSTAPFFVCGTPIQLNVLIKSDELTSPVTYFLTTGAPGAPKRFDSGDPVAIPDASAIGTNSTIVVSNVISAIRKLTVSAYITHTFDADLYFELIGPDGTTVLLSDHNGGSGNNYGASCAPDSFRTTFDDDSQSPISGGAPPFVGVFKPQQSLAAFVGKSGTNVNGSWTLRVVDDVGLDIGTLQCWSLHISTATCTDGGGTCPGAELGIGLSDAPDPVFIGSNLVYTITVTNNGPSQATNVVVNQQLPPSVVFATASASQGSVVYSSGTVVATLGTLPFEGRATISVTVIPTLAATISSTATIGSEQPDPNTANNSATAITQVNPPASDLVVGLFDEPDPVLLGQPLTYTVSVTNNGPSIASGVTVTNTFPISALIQSATPSQGNATIAGNLVVFTFGSLPNGGSATGTMVVTPGAEGTMIATAVARANQTDPKIANNTATNLTIVGPAADLVVTMTDQPDPVVVRSNWVYTITVTNNGPSVASSTVVNQSLASGITIVSSTTSLGTIFNAGNTVSANLGTLAKGEGAVIVVTVNSTNTGTFPSSVAVTAAQADAHPEDNSAQTSTLVALPFVSIEPAGVTLTAESFSPPDGGVGIGETVTVQFRLRNAGNVNNTNLTATLLATGGVTLPSPAGAVAYGVLPPGGLPVGQPFTFTATGTNGGTVTATLQLQDGGNNLTNVTFSFTLPSVLTFSNTTAITIPSVGNAAPYPSTINVSGVTGLVGKVTATLSNFTHSFPQDLDVLLVSPGSPKSLLMASAGAPFASGLNLTFDDGAALAIPQNGSLSSGAYRPASYGANNSLPAPAPGSPYATAMSAFNGADPNGLWSLYIVDRSAGDEGSITGGWSLAISVVSPVNQVADLAVTSVALPNPVLVGDAATFTFTVTNTGPNDATGVSFTNVVPATAVLLLATSSQGIVATNGNVVTGSLGDIDVGDAATVTVVVRPTAAGVLSLSGTAAASETDLNLSNNSGSGSTTVNAPVADLSVAVASTDAVVVGSNLTYTISVTNLGPQTALDVAVVDPLPAGLNFVSTTADSFSHSAGTVTVNLGHLVAGNSATFDLVVNASSAGTFTNVISGATSSSDPDGGNNSVSLVVTSSAPAPIITAAGAVLISESTTPPNATVDIGETVTVSLSLENIGSLNAANLVATLLNTGGVTASSGPQGYGALAAGGAAVSRPYSFTATGTNGGVVVATLQLQDGANDLGTATFSFNLPGTVSFTNPIAIAIPGQGSASPYPSSIEVSGLPGETVRAVVTLNGFTHGFPDDVDVMLVSPGGRKLMLMSDAGGGHAVTNVTLTFTNGSAALPDSSTISSGAFAATDYEPGDILPPPAPSSVTGDNLAVFNGQSPNGTWVLYVADDSTGDGGMISGGWTLTLTTVTPVNPVADLEVTMNGTPGSLYVGSAITYNLSVVNHGGAVADEVSLINTLPLGVNVISINSSQGTFTNSGSVVSFNLGVLPASATATATIRVVPEFGGSLVNSATVSGSGSDLNAINNTAQVSTTVLIPVRASLTDAAYTNGQLEFTLVGDAGMTYVVQSSTNLTTWTALSTNTAAVNGTVKFTDPSAGSSPLRFYRAVRLIP